MSPEPSMDLEAGLAGAPSVASSGAVQLAETAPPPKQGERVTVAVLSDGTSPPSGAATGAAAAAAGAAVPTVADSRPERHSFSASSQAE